MLKNLTALFLTAIISSKLFSYNLATDTLMEIMCADDSVSRQWCVKIKKNGQAYWQLWSKVYQNGDVSKVIDFKDINWLLGLDRPKSEKLRILEQALTIPKVFDSVKSENLVILWNAQTGEQGIGFFSNITELTGKQLRKFIEEKEASLQVKDDLMRHANSLIFSMELYHLNLIGGIANGIGRSSFGKYQEGAIKASYDWLRFSSANPSNLLIPFNMISNSMDLINLHFNNVSNISAKITRELANIEDLSPEKKGFIAFNSSERASLTYFLKEFEDIISCSYAYFSGEDYQENKFFESPELWQDFKSFYMIGLTFEKLLLLQPWFAELDRIAARIQNLTE